MSRQKRPGGPYVTPIAAGGATPAEAPRGAYTLASGTTYYAALGGIEAPLLSAHVRWDAAIVITAITVEDSNLSPDESTDIDATAGNWIPENPAGAYVAVVGAGATATGASVAVTGGAAGGAMFHLANAGALRTRLKIVVGGTGGIVRIAAHGKD